MSYLYPTFSGPAGALTQDPAPIVTVNGQRLRITKVHPTEGITFDRLGAEPAEGQAETVIESACGMIGSTFADLAAVVAHMENPPAPVVPVPASVTLWALRVILADDGLLPQILAYIATVEAAPTKHRLTQFIEYGNFVDRSSPTLAGIATLLNKTDAEIDAVFIRAAALKL